MNLAAVSIPEFCLEIDWSKYKSLMFPYLLSIVLWHSQFNLVEGGQKDSMAAYLDIKLIARFEALT